ncbi:MAG: hypothetical protein ACI8WB_005178 [Phenylobacterium sp.]|jgi:hypothetical protein
MLREFTDLFKESQRDEIGRHRGFKKQRVLLAEFLRC